jgi:transcriptional repressor NrdR
MRTYVRNPRKESDHGRNMKCPLCNFPDSRVLDSRPVEDGASIKRRRECPNCGRRFTTYEVVDTVPITVIKRDGRQEFFDKHKLVVGIMRACQKRSVNAEDIASSIECELQNSLITEIKASDIGEMVLDRLRDRDIVSYIRFASVYREFKDLDSFAEEIRALNKENKKKASK